MPRRPAAPATAGCRTTAPRPGRGCRNRRSAGRTCPASSAPAGSAATGRAARRRGRARRRPSARRRGRRHRRAEPDRIGGYRSKACGEGGGAGRRRVQYPPSRLGVCWRGVRRGGKGYVVVAVSRSRLAPLLQSDTKLAEAPVGAAQAATARVRSAPQTWIPVPAGKRIARAQDADSEPTPAGLVLPHERQIPPAQVRFRPRR